VAANVLIDRTLVCG